MGPENLRLFGIEPCSFEGTSLGMWSQSQTVTSYLVDSQRRLSLPGLLSLFQEMAWCHAERAGHGYSVMIERGHGWVLARQEVRVSDWPEWNEVVELRTWLRPPRGLLVYRDFEMWSGDELLARGVGMWMAIDMNTRQPVTPFLGQAQFRPGLDFQPMRIDPFDSGPELSRIMVRPSDLDLNGHVNNVRYAAWVLDLASQANRYEINFLAELGLGQQVVLESGPPGLYQGRRLDDGRVVFTTRLGS